jgi:hypothetical protein
MTLSTRVLCAEAIVRALAPLINEAQRGGYQLALAFIPADSVKAMGPHVWRMLQESMIEQFDLASVPANVASPVLLSQHRKENPAP